MAKKWTFRVTKDSEEPKKQTLYITPNVHELCAPFIEGARNVCAVVTDNAHSFIVCLNELAQDVLIRFKHHLVLFESNVRTLAYKLWRPAREHRLYLTSYIKAAAQKYLTLKHVATLSNHVQNALLDKRVNADANNIELSSLLLRFLEKVFFQVDDSHLTLHNSTAQAQNLKKAQPKVIELTLSSDVTETHSQKFIQADSHLLFRNRMHTTYFEDMPEMQTATMVLSSLLSVAITKFRTLGETDVIDGVDTTMNMIDNMSLNDLDYVTLT